MKILHCCLANYYIDNCGYQENLITRMHKCHGHDVYILASTETFVFGNNIGLVKPSTYVNEDGIIVTRVPYTKLLPKQIGRKVRIYSGVSDIINKFAPEIIFLHDAQTVAVYQIIDYIKQNPKVRLYIDSHTDFVNSAKGWISKHILHGLFYKYLVRKTIPYTVKYYGTLPARVRFYSEFYGTPISKTEYLPMGVDDLSIDFSQRENIRSEVRNQIGFSHDDFIIVTGGKLEKRKRIIELIHAFIKSPNPKVKLLIFGSVKDDIKEEWNNIINSDNRIKHIGWVQAKETYKYLFASDLACFPGTHSTLWEETVGCGVPAIFKKWNGIEHVDRGGNCIMLDDTSVEKMLVVIQNLVDNSSLYSKLLSNARSAKTMDYFAYSKIAKVAIEDSI